MAYVDMDLAERALTKEELQIFNILLGKVQDLEDFVNGWHEQEDELEVEVPLTYLYTPAPEPPKTTFRVYCSEDVTTGLYDDIKALNEENAVLEWYKKNNLKGDLTYSKSHNIWRYKGFQIHLERLDGDEY